jgi:hypothetical protein
LELFTARQIQTPYIYGGLIHPALDGNTILVCLYGISYALQNFVSKS